MSAFRTALIAVIVGRLLVPAAVSAQGPKGVIAGTAKDASGGPLQGARVELQPAGKTVATDMQGRFRLTDLGPGHYDLTVSYVGFTPFIRAIDYAGDAGSFDENASTVPLSRSVLFRGSGALSHTDALPADSYTFSTAIRLTTGEIHRETVAFDVRRTR